MLQIFWADRIRNDDVLRMARIETQLFGHITIGFRLNTITLLISESKIEGKRSITR